jgi:hypothetical protein
MEIWSDGKLTLFLLFVIPGFVSLKAYRTINPGLAVKSADQLIDAIAYSCINYAILAPFIYFIVSYRWWVSHSVWFTIFCFLALLVAPMGWAVALTAFRRTEFARKWLPHPTDFAWEFFFSQKRPCWIIATLQDGSKVGGLYAGASFAASGVAKGDIYLEQAWLINDDGGLERRRTETDGILIFGDSIRGLEFFQYLQDSEVSDGD